MVQSMYIIFVCYCMMRRFRVMWAWMVSIPLTVLFHYSLIFRHSLSFISAFLSIILSPNYLTFRFLLLWSSSPISLQSRYCQITILICYDRCSLCLATITLISNDNVSAMNTFLPCLLVCFISRICQNTFLSWSVMSLGSCHGRKLALSPW